MNKRPTTFANDIAIIKLADKYQKDWTVTLSNERVAENTTVTIAGIIAVSKLIGLVLFLPLL